MRFLFLLAAILDPNPMVGPNNDWAPLIQEYENCASVSASYFQYTICTMSAYDKAVHPTYSA